MRFASILIRRSPRLAGGVEVYYTENEENDTECLIHVLRFLSEYQTRHQLSVRAMPTVIVNDERSSAKKVLATFTSEPKGALEISGIIGVQFHDKCRPIFRAYLDALEEERENIGINFEEPDEENSPDIEALYEFFAVLKEQYFPDQRVMH